MTVIRIVPNLPAKAPVTLARFYAEVFDLTVPMDMGWIAFLQNDQSHQIELHTASEGGSGTDMPIISVEVDDLFATLDRLNARGIAPTYGPVDEPWGIRRFYFHDPEGNLINVVTHID
ncbi:MAG: VOC family protein [Pseudomonadota bacterium]|nr:VOC family protein [Pseudomonadota bacterium]